MEDQLEIRLQQPPWRNARFVGDFEHGLVVAYRTLDAGEVDFIAVQVARVANPPIAYAGAQHIKFAVRE